MWFFYFGSEKLNFISPSKITWRCHHFALFYFVSFSYYLSFFPSSVCEAALIRENIREKSFSNLIFWFILTDQKQSLQKPKLNNKTQQAQRKQCRGQTIVHPKSKWLQKKKLKRRAKEKTTVSKETKRDNDPYQKKKRNKDRLESRCHLILQLSTIPQLRWIIE